MPATRKRFVCGHRGYGSYCHRCDQAKQLAAMKLSSSGEVCAVARRLGVHSSDETNVDVVKVALRAEVDRLTAGVPR